jgi:hypothetical protein
MAKYISNMRVRGTLYGVTYRQTKDGMVMQEKPGPSSEQVKNDPEFVETRKMSSEFGKACTGSRILAQLFSEAIEGCHEKRVNRRLVSVLRKVISSDTVSPKGEKNLVMGDNRLLKGFEWNKNARFGAITRQGITTRIDRKSGQVIFDFSSYVPINVLRAPKGATHYRITAAAAELNWKDNVKNIASHTTEYMPWDGERTQAFSVMVLLNENTKKPIVCNLSIRWYLEVNGIMTPMYNEGFNAAEIVEVEV